MTKLAVLDDNGKVVRLNDKKRTVLVFNPEDVERAKAIASRMNRDAAGGPFWVQQVETAE